MAPETSRRCFLSWALFGLGGIFSAILGVPIVCYAIDPRHRKGKQSDFKLVEGIRLDELEENKPIQGVIRDTRRDGWILYPNDVVGRVWVILRGPRPANLESQEDKDKYLLVFTTICPHLGCSVNLNSSGDGFLCPCHKAAFAVDGAKNDADSNPAGRGMDTLEWQIDPANPERIKVRYQNFASSIKEKKLA
jgi:menaquinol-cytochrome c reductase iron-sulfur subunit